MKKESVLVMTLCLVSFNTYAAGECKTGETAYTNGVCVDNKCTACYNKTTQDLRIVKNSNVGENEEVIYQQGIGRSNGSDCPAKNVTIEEGITGAKAWVFGYGTRQGCDTCVLKLPSTFKTVPENQDSFWNNQFGIVDLSAIKNLDIQISTTKEQTIILAPNSGVNVYAYGAYGSYPDVNIQCKGTDFDACKDMVKTAKNVGVTGFEGYDENGVYVSYSENGKKAFDLPNGDYRFYDKDGKYVGNFMSDGQKRRIYAIDEAVAVTEKSNKNRFVLRYR